MKVHLPEELDGLAVCAVAAAVCGMALHIRSIHPSALASRQQLIHLLWIEQPQPGTGYNLLMVKADISALIG